MQLSDRVNLILDAYCRKFRLPKPIAMSLGWKLISSDLSSLDQEDRNYLNHHDYDLDQRRHCREVCVQHNLIIQQRIMRLSTIKFFS